MTLEILFDRAFHQLNPKIHFVILQAPKMNTDRYMHGCATFKNEGKTYTVAAGGYSITQGGKYVLCRLFENY